MKLVTYADGDRVGVGRVGEDDVTVHDLTGVVGHRTLLEVIDEWEHLGPAIAAAPAPPVEAEPRLLAPIPNPRRNLFAIGKNYREHVREFGRSGYDSPDRSEDIPTAPVVFSKATTTVIGPFDDLDPHAAVTSELDYEAELAVIIGRGGRELIRVISAGITLLPGDVIATGTPAGVGIGFDPPRFLAPGDVVECAITGLGALRNTVRSTSL
jgi:2-keto-4-pentenoate hydratase/2-oxohepta-3-ene-1,7-dioic acid hydratase in catechol pathway